MGTAYKHISYPNTDRQLLLAMPWTSWHGWIIVLFETQICIYYFHKEKLGIKG